MSSTPAPPAPSGGDCARTGCRAGRARTLRVAAVEPLGAGYLRLTLAARPGEGPLERPLPGQFAMVGVGGDRDPLLKRPLCVLSATEGSVSFLVREVGRGTRMLAGAREGDELAVVGPLGRPWPELPPGRPAVALAGGTGIASVYPLLASRPGEISLVYGARTASEFVVLDELGGLARQLVLATDDGTRGARGTALDVWGATTPDPGTVLYVCGPRGMVRAAALAARARGVAEAYASIEEYMACGVGACVGCVVRTVRGYERVCTEGPVFAMGEVDWAEGAA